MILFIVRTQHCLAISSCNCIAIWWWRHNTSQLAFADWMSNSITLWHLNCCVIWSYMDRIWMQIFWWCAWTIEMRWIKRMLYSYWLRVGGTDSASSATGFCSTWDWHSYRLNKLTIINISLLHNIVQCLMLRIKSLWSNYYFLSTIALSWIWVERTTLVLSCYDFLFHSWLLLGTPSTPTCHNVAHTGMVHWTSSG